MTERFAGEDLIELPPHRTAYCIVPQTIEFCQGWADRLQDRFRYTARTTAIGRSNASGPDSIGR
jgi:pyridoxine/pyridoxamine 5'-phosphate oxidase